MVVTRKRKREGRALALLDDDVVLLEHLALHGIDHDLHLLLVERAEEEVVLDRAADVLLVLLRLLNDAVGRVHQLVHRHRLGRDACAAPPVAAVLALLQRETIVSGTMVRC